MANIIEMPKLSDTMTMGTLVNWLKKEGDRVVAGDMIAEVETDKATMELESFDEGILLRQMVKPGEQVPCGTPIAAIGEEGEKIDVSAIGGKSPTADEPGQKEPEKAAKAQEPPSFEEGQEGPAQHDQPASSTEIRDPGARAEPEQPDAGGRLRASPLARRIAAEHGVSLESIKGSGPAGRILKADVLAAAARGPTPAATTPAPGAPPQVPAGAGIDGDKTIQVSNMRATIARRLIESKTQIPHFYLELEIDAEPLLKVRQQVNKSLEELPPEKGGGKLSVNDFILKACAEALLRVPAANSSWQNNAIHQYASADVSVAVAVEDGLITPVVRQAHAKTVRQISAEVKNLVWKAKNKKLKPEEFTGGTFTVSNLGMYGIDRFSAIINPPNSAILAVGATRKIPVVKNDQIVIGQRMSLTLSGDHRVVDGAAGAQFLAVMRELLETPALALV